MESRIFDTVRDCLIAGKPVALATVIGVQSASEQRSEGHPTSADDNATTGVPAVGSTMLVTPGAESIGTLGNSDLDRVVSRDALGALDAGQDRLRSYGPQGQNQLDTLTVFIESFAPPPHMIIFGATDFASSLARIAKVLGYYVTVCDAREVFATRVRFPEADEVIVSWPHRYLEERGGSCGERDAICVLSHDEKFDVPAIVAALHTSAGYIGVMGSRRTIAERLAQLRGEGVHEADIQRLMAPIGLDIGARTPDETAIAIIGEIIARGTQSPAPSLRDQLGPIHRRTR